MYLPLATCKEGVLASGKKVLLACGKKYILTSHLITCLWKEICTYLRKKDVLACGEKTHTTTCGEKDALACGERNSCLLVYGAMSLCHERKMYLPPERSA